MKAGEQQRNYDHSFYSHAAVLALSQHIAIIPVLRQIAGMDRAPANRKITQHAANPSPAAFAKIVDTLALAFQNDPAFAWILPNPEIRRARLPQIFRFLAREDFAAGSAWHSPEMEVATLWRAPGRHKDVPLGMLRTQITYLSALRTASLRGDAVGKSMAAHHPAGNHHYLRFVGVHPDKQGKGWGGAAIRAGIERADADGLPIYLETATQSNVGLYKRFGFDVTAEWDVPNGGPHFWAMSRG
jgi:ribosomal protein S18 acetylase RimI-like enzyme